MYFRSRGVITDDQLILGLGILPEECPGDNVDSEGAGAEDLADAAHHRQPTPKQLTLTPVLDIQIIH
jgi:hypothetical protein